MALNEVRLNVADSAKLRAYLKRLNPRQRRSVSGEALEKVARATSLNAKTKQIARGRGLHSKPLPKRLTWRSGDLTRSIAVDSSRAPLVQIVGSPMEYAAVHEQGISPFPRRPYLQPASDHVLKTQASGFFKDALRRARFAR